MTESLLRIMKDDDLDLILSWRNHPSIREQMYSRHEISKQEHEAWFAKMKMREDVDLLLFELDGKPSAYAKLDVSLDAKTAVWGFYKAPNAEPGTGTLLGNAVLKHAFESRKLEALTAEVIANNEKSLSFHTKMGFKQDKLEENKYFDAEKYHAVICMSITATDWRTRQIRPAFSERDNN